MKPLLLTGGLITLLAVCFIFFSCTKTYNCTCVPRSANQSELKYLIKNAKKENAQKTCDSYEYDSATQLEYECTLK